MELWFKTYREIEGDRRSPLVFDLSEPSILQVATPLEEAVNAVHKICNTHPGPYSLLVSGGVDSQTMIYAWKLSGVPFSIVHYTYGDNIEDGETLKAFCELQDLSYETRYFDVDRYINSDEYKQMAITHDCASPHILTYMKLASFHPETVIVAGNFISLTSTSLNWTILGLDRYRQISKQNFVPFFLCSTPEITYSFCREEKQLANEYKFKEIPESFQGERTYFYKVKTYETSGIPVIRQSKKLTGFEGIKEKYDSVKINRLAKIKWSHMPSTRHFDVLFRYGLFDVLPQGFYTDKYTIIHNDFINRI